MNIRYRWRLLRAGPLWLDGDSMFGIVPRVVWSRSVPSDDLGRIEVAHNCLLLERIGPGDGPRRVLIESGSGDKIDPKMRKIYGLNDQTIQIALEQAGCRCDEVDHAIVTHLHFDHCGGLTRLTHPGESPDWSGPIGHSADSAGVKLTFPNAPITVQRREWEDALANRSTMTRTYLRDNLEPIRDRLCLVDSPPPFPPGVRPDRNQDPAMSLAERSTPVLPGIAVFSVPGHTWGQQAIRFADEQNNTVVFSPDVMPTIHHVGAAYNMAYDQEPYTSTLTRRWFLAAAAAENWLLVLDHEPGNPMQRVRPDGKGWFQLQPEKRKI